MPYPPKPRCPAATLASESSTRSRVACRRRSSYWAPWMTPHSDCSGLPSRSAVWRLCSSMQRAAHRWVRSTEASWYERVSMRVVSSSKAKMMSAPSWCWICMEISGVKRWREPSMKLTKSTPSSSTRAMFFFSRPQSWPSFCSMVSVFWKPTPWLITWKPPESV